MKLGCKLCVNRISYMLDILNAFFSLRNSSFNSFDPEQPISFLL